jgi:hypothetical protein
VDYDPQYCSIRLIANCSDLMRAYPFAIDYDPAGQLIERWPGRVSIDEDLIFLLELESRMCNPVRKLSVVRQK